jgi:hypothetical protein
MAESKSKGGHLPDDVDSVFPYLYIAQERVLRCNFRRGRWPLGDSRRHPSQARGGLAAVVWQINPRLDADFGSGGRMTYFILLLRNCSPVRPPFI